MSTPLKTGAAWTQAAAQHTASRNRRTPDVPVSNCTGDPRSTEPADLALDEGPGRGAELGFPALIETAAELRAESVHVGGIEHQSPRGEFRLELAVEIVGVGALQRDVL